MKLKFGIALLMILLMISCAEQSKDSAKPQKVKSQEVVAVNEEHSQSVYSGRVVAASDANLSFRVAGVIESIGVAVGDYVTKGEVVAYMDPRDYKLQLAATQAEYDAIKGEVDRVVALHAKQSVTDNDYQKAVNGLKQISSKLSAHTNALNDTKLRAPFSGYVQKINFEKGEAVAAGMPVVSIVSSSLPEVVINVAAGDYLKREQLAGAVAKVNIMPNSEFKLKYRGTARKANLNQLYQMTFGLEPMGDEPMPAAGMSAMVTLDFAALNAGEAVSIPFTALLEREGKSSVWVVENGSVSLKSVSVSQIKSDGTAIVNSGLEAGDEVVTAGVNNLTEGQKVRK